MQFYNLKLDVFVLHCDHSSIKSLIAAVTKVISSASLMLITSNLFYEQQLLLHLMYLLLGSFILAACRKLCLAFSTCIARLAILRRLSQIILKSYQTIFRQMQLFNWMFQDLHHVKPKAGLIGCQDLPSNIQ